jgi:hypothetical protein
VYSVNRIQYIEGTIIFVCSEKILGVADVCWPTEFTRLEFTRYILLLQPDTTHNATLRGY